MSSLCHPFVILKDDINKGDSVHSKRDLTHENLAASKQRWTGKMNRPRIQTLRLLTRSHQFSVNCGDLIWLDGGWYVTHTGLIRLAGVAAWNTDPDSPRKYH